MTNHPIKVTKTTQSSLSSVDFSDIPFGKVFSDHMFVVDFDGKEWKNAEIKPLQHLSIHPGNLAWHYGQSIFEGMKATKLADGTPALFRPEMHAKRINASAARMCMAEIPEDLFLQAVEMMVSLESAWIPPAEGSALYIRPLMFATDEFIGVRPSTLYKFIIFTMPVGPYYPKPVSLLAEEHFIRAAYGGVGEAKAAGNYAASLYPAKLAKEKGYDQVLWLDARESKYIQEVGTMNIFFVIGDKLITPITDGTILKGITRDSLIQIAKRKGLFVEERLISIDEVVNAHEDGSLKEVFGAGTAAVISTVSKIGYRGKDYVLDHENYKIGPMLKAEINGIRSGRVEDSYDWVKKIAPSLVGV